MTWLQHSSTQIAQAGVECHFLVGGLPLKGWIMPDGMGVFHQDGITLEIPPESIVTTHKEGLRRARQGAATRHFERHVLSYAPLGHGEWFSEDCKWVKEARTELAGLPGQLTIHVTFKAGAAELMRFYTEFQSDRHAQAHGSHSVRPGCVGDAYAGGEVVRTASGRLTSPFPKIDTGNHRRAVNTLKRVHQWLIQNAWEEALARSDEFNARQFKGSLSNPQQVDKDSAEQYLFGPQSSVRR